MKINIYFVDMNINFVFVAVPHERLKSLFASYFQRRQLKKFSELTKWAHKNRVKISNVANMENEVALIINMQTQWREIEKEKSK